MGVVQERLSYHVGKLLAVLVLNFVIKPAKRGLLVLPQAGEKELEELSEEKPPAYDAHYQLLRLMALARLVRSQGPLRLLAFSSRRWPCQSFAAL